MAEPMLRRLALMLALCLLLQWSAAFAACCVLPPDPLASVPICTTHGPAERPAKPHGKAVLHADQCCPACHQLPMLPAIDSVQVKPSSAWWTVPAVSRVVRLLPVQARAPPPIRGPPTA